MSTRRLFALASCLLLPGAAACGPDPSGDSAAAPQEPSPAATFAVAVPKGGPAPLLSGDGVDVTAENGVIDGVTVTDAAGAELPTTQGDDGLVARWAKEPNHWRLTGVLAPKTAYRLAVTGHNADGTRAQQTLHVTTREAPRLQTRVNPGDDNVVGVGMPVQFRFSRDVPDRKAVQRHLTMKTTPEVEGSWGWTDDRTVTWRPKDFWPAKTTVEAALDITGHHLGEGVYGGTKRSVAFTIGRDLRMTIDDDTHEMTVLEGGKAVRTLPVSMGRSGPRTTTRSGTKIVYEKNTPYTMRGESADPYVTTVKHAQRLTDSGEFLHGAPWSVGAQGRRNVSHGCVNLSPSAAKWLYDTTLIGDPVVTTGTTRQAETWNGLGGIWNYPWKEWRKLSAL